MVGTNPQIFRFALAIGSSLTVLGAGTARAAEERPAETKGFAWSGTLCITVDDGLRWVHTDLAETLAVLNDEFGLRGTDWEMRATVFANVEGLNGLRDRHPDHETVLSGPELVELHRGGLVEVGLHGYTAGAMDPSAHQVPWGVHGGGWNASGTRDSTSYEMIVDGLRALRDTLGLPVVSFAPNGHRQTSLAVHLASKWGLRNVRAGTRLEGPENAALWPDAGSGGTSPSLVKLGQVRERNRPTIDRAAYWWNGYSNVRLGSVLPFHGLHRLWLPHQAPPSAARGIGARGIEGARERADSTEALIYSLAENKGFGALVWHDMNEAGGPQSLGGLEGVGRVLRFAGELCRNGLLGNDEPRLQVLGLDDGVTKHVGWRDAFADRSLNMVDNWWMRPADARLSERRPWGTPDGVVPSWSDSGWVYVDSLAASKNGFFGYHGEGGALFTTTEGERSPASLLMVTPVVPGSRAAVSFWATADTFEVDATKLDSLAAATFGVEVTFFAEGSDPGDTTASWLDGEGGGALDPIGHASLGRGSNRGANRFDAVKMWGAFHARDAWRIARRAEHRGVGNWWHDGETVVSSPEAAMRWREFSGFVDVPPSARIARWRLVPEGFGEPAATDTIGVTGFEVNCTVR